MLRGSMVALVTPFNKKGDVDYEKLKELVEFHIKSGTDVLVPCGTTGESPTLSHEEHNRVVDVVVETAAHHIPVIAGTGSNSTTETLMLTQHAKEAGADAALVITPYYNKPTQRGLIAHFEKVADIGIPIILYNVPGRTGVSLDPSTVVHLARHQNIAGIKEASGNLDNVSKIISQCDITVVSGDDSLTLPMLALGGKGVISVAANLVPEDVASLVNCFENGELEKAQEFHYKLLPLFKGLFVETNPIPIKAAMAMCGMIEEEYRLPLCRMSDANREKLKEVLKESKLL